jgi:general secretion pathway protein G
MMRLQRILKLLAARRAERVRRGQAGYTLTEILIVMAIISMLMGAAGFIGFRRLDQSRLQQSRNLMLQIKQAYVQWQTTPGNEGCPPNLAALMDNRKEPKDGWGHPYILKCPSEHEEDIDLISLGKDGKEGTADDLHSWDEPETKK